MSVFSKNISDFLVKTNFSKLKPELFEAAFTHPSYAFEHSLGNEKHYERLEFLGDAVLKLIISNLLFNRFPNYDEGKLTNIRAILVSDDFLYTLSEDLDLKKYIRISKSLEKDGGRNVPSISACVFEAFLGKLFEIGISISELSIFLENIYSQYIDNIDSLLPKFNAKTILQEYTQAKNKDLPIYKQELKKGTENNCEFIVKVFYQGEQLGRGIGKNKKQAEREAAYQACLKLNITGEKL